MTKILLWGFFCIAGGIIAAIAFASKVATYLGWLSWLVFLIIFLDVVFVFAIPFTLREYTANIALYTHRIPLAHDSADYPPSCAYLLILTTVIIPAIVFLWLLYMVVQ